MTDKFAFIDAEKAMFPIRKMCVWLEVSTSGYYEWRDRPASATAQRRQRLAVVIQAIFEEFDNTYGYRRVHAALARQGDGCGPELVRDIMRERGLVPCQPRPWRPTTTQPGDGAQAVPDLVGRDFSADAPGRKLVGDITYLPTWQGFAYLLVTWNHAAGWSFARRRYHGLRGRVAGVDGADGEVAGPGSARARGAVAAGLDRFGAGAAHDRCLRPWFGGVSAGLRA